MATLPVGGSIRRAGTCRVCHLQFVAFHPLSTPPREYHGSSNRKQIRGAPCAACLEPLGDSLPSSAYLRNSRKSPHSRRCHRCLAGCAPLWSRSLRTVSLRLNDFQSTVMPTLGGRALCVVLRHIGLTSTYKVPWTNGFPRIALFLGSKYTRPCRNRAGGVRAEPVERWVFRVGTLRKEKWYRRGGCVTTRTCCGYEGWLGVRCVECGRYRNDARVDWVCCSSTWLGWRCMVCGRTN
jgi:hypothetical protein